MIAMTITVISVENDKQGTNNNKHITIVNTVSAEYVVQ